MAKCCVGWHHTICLSDSGKVYSFGKNDLGQLGLGHYDSVLHPTHLSTLSKIRAISCGYHFTVCIDEEGIAWSFGENGCGQLGTGNIGTCNNPKQISDIPPIQSITCGGYHTLFIDYNENLWSAGRNDCGQLALGTGITQGKPKQTSFTDIVNMSAGFRHSMFQNKKGEIYSCGDNSHGELGWEISEPTDQHQICKIFNQPPNIVQFCCGFHHSLFLDEEGNVFGVGMNAFGCVGIGDSDISRKGLIQIQNIPHIQKLFCSGYSSYLIDFDGNVWSFGLNSSGQLGHFDEENRNIPTKIPSISEIVEISSGSCGYHFLAKNSQNEIFVVGNNQYGQLGNDTKTSLSIPEMMKAEYFTIWGNSLKSRAKSARK